MAGIGTGMYTCAKDAVSQTIKRGSVYEPNPRNAEIYDKGYYMYRKIYTDLKNV